MPIFGFLGPLLSAEYIPELLRFGACFAGFPESATQTSPGPVPIACFGNDIAVTGTVAVAVTGGPFWLSDHTTTCGRSTCAVDILSAYRESGSRFLTRLSGRYSLAIADSEARRVILAVDSMGIEPLAYAACGRGIVFSSSAEAVARSPAIRAGVSAQAVFDYLVHHIVPAPDTIFQGVHKLRAGTHLIWEDGRGRTARHWIPHFRDQSQESFDLLKSDLNASLRRAVADCEPDERTGAFLSGGLDSSTVAGVLSEIDTRPARTFTIGFGYPDYDELEYARIANRRYRCEGHEYVIRGADIAATFPEIARAYDEPFGNSSALPVYYCARTAREAGVSRLLAGDGGDELFAGNSRYAEQMVFERYKLAPQFLRERLLEPILQRLPDSLAPRFVARVRGYVDKANVPLPLRLESWNFIRQLGTAEIIDPDFMAGIDLELPWARMQELWDAAPTRSVLQRMLFYDWQYTLADNDLRKVETMSALAGVTVAYPMLHPDVVELSTRVPPRMLMPGNRLRDFYKRAMTDFLPEQIIQKKKHGFGLPFGLWLQESKPLRDLIYGNLSNLRSRRVIRPEFLDRILTLHGETDARYYGVFIWVLAMLEQWFQEHQLAP